jgi:drug/metabolite transporter (DMT)-like permease
LLGVICWSIYTLTASEFPHFSGIRYTTFSITLGAIILGITSLILTHTGYIHAPAFSTLWSEKFTLLFLSLITGVFAILIWNNGIKKLGASNGVLFMNLIPIFVLVIGLIRGQTVSSFEIIGFCLTLLALVINNINTRLVSHK